MGYIQAKNMVKLPSFHSLLTNNFTMEITQQTCRLLVSIAVPRSLELCLETNRVRSACHNSVGLHFGATPPCLYILALNFEQHSVSWAIQSVPERVGLPTIVVNSSSVFSVDQH